MQSRASATLNQGSNADVDIDSDSAINGVRDASLASLTCSECSQTFRRREHLSRHLDRHSGRRSYTCSVCKTAFSRRYSPIHFPRNAALRRLWLTQRSRDTLRRHIGTHGTAALEAWEQDNPRFSRHQLYRACQACARAKQRCDGRSPAPCTKCASKGRRCLYQPNPGNGETLVHTQPVTSDDTSVTLPSSSSSQPLQPLTPLPSWLEPDSSTWDALLTSTQFLLPFAHIPSLEAGTSPDFNFGYQQGSFGAEATQIETVEDVEALTELNNLTAEEQDVLIAENIPHVSPLTSATRKHMIQAIKEAGLPQNEAQGLDANFPCLRHLNTYMQLYFEHFHPQMPFLHVPTFQASPENWQLILSIVSLGSRYSLAPRHQDHFLLLQRVLQHMLKRDLRELTSVDLLISAQSHLLFQQSLWLSGEWAVTVELQFYRNILITLCRLLLSREGTLMHTHTSTEDANDAWLQWIQAEAKRRIVHFTYITECLYATFLMLPPLLSTTELQIPLPTANSYWSSNYEQWHLLPTPQPSSTLCPLLARVGLGHVAHDSLEQLTKSLILCSASIQQAAEGDFLRAMGLDSIGTTTRQPSLAMGMVTTISKNAFDALSHAGCSQALHETHPGSQNDFAFLSRVLTILSFTPLSLLFSYHKWQTTDVGQSNARSQLLNIIPQDVGRARHCLYYAAQTYQHFRTTKPATVLDVMGALVCVLYMVLYVDIIEKQGDSFAGLEGGDISRNMDIIRLGQVVDGHTLNDWLQVRSHKRLHVTGVGFLHTEGSILRLYKEGSRIMARGSSISRMAKSMSNLLESQARGYPLTDKTFGGL
ncbi:hypothetical protein FG05_04725 [Fusarium graminearum]|nr:hypothetical protein FG05_04725 [Fusarium graminearum]